AGEPLASGGWLPNVLSRSKPCHLFEQSRTAESHIAKPLRTGINIVKQESDQFPPGNRPNGLVATTGVPPEPGSGDDAAADAGHQAAAALQSRSRAIRRG